MGRGSTGSVTQGRVCLFANLLRSLFYKETVLEFWSKLITVHFYQHFIEPAMFLSCLDFRFKVKVTFLAVWVLLNCSNKKHPCLSLPDENVLLRNVDKMKQLNVNGNGKPLNG